MHADPCLRAVLPFFMMPARSQAAAATASWATGMFHILMRASLQVLAEGAAFGAALGVDYVTGRISANEQQRAMQLRRIIERLGPAYVKVNRA